MELKVRALDIIEPKSVQEVEAEMKSYEAKNLPPEKYNQIAASKLLQKVQAKC